MKSLLILLSVIISATLFSQTREHVWFEADITLMDGTNIKGEANYNLRSQIIQVITGERVFSYSESQVKEMWLRNEQNEHHFMLIPLKNELDRVMYNLVEVIYQSKDNYSYVKRYKNEKKRLVSPTNPARSPQIPVVRDLTLLTSPSTTNELRANADKDSFTSVGDYSFRQSFERFIINYDGFCKKVNRKNLFEAVAAKRKEIKKYMKKNLVGTERDDHMIAILSEYDRLIGLN